MNAEWQKYRRRRLELLADRALFGLNETEEAELDELLWSTAACDDDMMDRVAAASALGLGIAQQRALPAALLDRIRASAVRVLNTYGG